LIGQDRKNSTLSVLIANAPGTGGTITENNTALLPVVETEVGFEWGKDLGELFYDKKSNNLFTVRVAGIAQYFGGMGPLSADSNQAFRTNDLFLAGVSVQVGLRH
jgi:hypothetical protein